MKRISGLSSVIIALKKVCALLTKYGDTIRADVPAGSQASYDAAIDAVLSACETIRGIEFEDEAPGTTAPWGE